MKKQKKPQHDLAYTDVHLLHSIHLASQHSHKPLNNQHIKKLTEQGYTKRDIEQAHETYRHIDFQKIKQITTYIQTHSKNHSLETIIEKLLSQHVKRKEIEFALLQVPHHTLLPSHVQTNTTQLGNESSPEQHQHHTPSLKLLLACAAFFIIGLLSFAYLPLLIIASVLLVYIIYQVYNLLSKNAY